MKSKIYVVEDDQMLRSLLLLFLEDLGYTDFKAFRNGEDMLDELNAGKEPELVLMDIHLEDGMNGVAVTRILYEKYKWVPVLFVSDELPEKHLAEILELGYYYGFLKKPFSKEDVRNAIQLAFEKSKNEEKTLDVLLFGPGFRFQAEHYWGSHTVLPSQLVETIKKLVPYLDKAEQTTVRRQVTIHDKSYELHGYRVIHKNNPCFAAKLLASSSSPK